MNKNILQPNRVLDADSYKLSHAKLYPSTVTGMFAYIESRSRNKVIVPFGLQMWVKKTLLTPVTAAEVDEAEAFAKLHGEPFDRADWDYLIERYRGYLPLTIKAVPEGMPVPSLTPIVTVECTDPRLFWLVSYVETSLQRGVWYPTTIASNDHANWRIIKSALDRSADNFDLAPFMLHDFGGRGASSEESAQIGGAAHLVHFMGSDTISGIRAANFYYNSPMSAFSVPATEHSIQCSYGEGGQRMYLGAVLSEYAKEGAILSVVIDGYDVYRETELLCTEFKDKIIASKARVVFRPDSGDPLEVIPRILALQAVAFGYTVNSKGYKVINNVGIIQGDGVNTESMQRILDKVTALGYSASNIVFGSGGALLQKVDRDTYKFAQKASAIKVDGEWHGIYKDPVTDPGKRSKAGRVTLLKGSMSNSDFLVGDTDVKHDPSWTEVLQTVYAGDGKLLVETTLDEVRARARS